MQLFIFHCSYPKTFFPVILNWNTSNNCYVLGCNLHPCDWDAPLDFRVYGSYHPHAVKCVVDATGHLSQSAMVPTKLKVKLTELMFVQWMQFGSEHLSPLSILQVVSSEILIGS